MKDFFERYAAAFLSVDPSNVSQLYLYPVTFFLENGSIVILEENDFLENSKKLFEIYSELGVNEIKFEIMSEEDANKAFKMVSVKWTFIKACDIEIYSAITRYLLQSETMKIVSVTTVDEMSKIELLRKH